MPRDCHALRMTPAPTSTIPSTSAPPLNNGGMACGGVSVVCSLRSPSLATFLVSCVVKTGIAKPATPRRTRMIPAITSPLIERPISLFASPASGEKQPKEQTKSAEHECRAGDGMVFEPANERLGFVLHGG